MTRPELMTTCPGCGCAVERRLPDDWEGEIESIPTWIREMPLWCSTCHAEREEQEAAAERERIRVQVERSAAIPAPLVERTRSVTLPAGLDALMSQWATGEVLHVVLTGPFGVGKTTAAAVAAVRRVERSEWVRWTTAPSLLARLGYGMGSPECADALKTLEGRRALVLDDLDKVRPTEYGAEQVFNAIDSRLTKGGGLLVTTNLTPAELATRWPDPYGPAIASRLGGECRVVQLQGNDRRFESKQPALIGSGA
jgi:DNA replication protein DnaC